MKCYRNGCEKTAPMFTLYRVNAKGQPGIWSCAAHRLERDSELDRIVAEIERQQRERTGGNG